MGTPNNTLPFPNKKAETVEQKTEQLRQWVTNNKSTLEILLDSYCVVNLESKVIEFNTAFMDLVGESYRKILKKGDFNLLFNTELGKHQCPVQQILDSQKPLRLDQLGASTKSFPKLSVIFGGIPVFNDHKELLGVLCTIRDVTAEDALQKKYLDRKAESITDGLTQLYNKSFAEESLLRFVKTSLREIRSFGVCLCDIDFFKKVNDTYGHQAGDYVLSVVAKKLHDAARGSDIVGRYGGEEFIVILSNTDAKGASLFAERFRTAIENAQVVFEGTHIPLTVSVGVATFTESYSKGSDPENMMKTLVSQADKALYYSKEHGRNRVTIWSDMDEKDKEA